MYEFSIRNGRTNNACINKRSKMRRVMKIALTLSILVFLQAEVGTKEKRKISNDRKCK